MIECWPGRRTSFMRSRMCMDLWSSAQGERERQRAAIGKSACFDVEAVVEIDGVIAGPTRSHIALRNLRQERSKTRGGSGSSDCSVNSRGSSDFEFALVFERPGQYTLPIQDITRIKSKHLHEGKASIEARDSVFLLSAGFHNELEGLLEVIADVKAVNVLADSRLCALCKDKNERKVKPKEQQQPTVLECIFRKKQLRDLCETAPEQVYLKDLLRRRESDYASHRCKGGTSPLQDIDTRPTGLDEECCQDAAGEGNMCEGLSKPDDGLCTSPVRTKCRDMHEVEPKSPRRRIMFIDEMLRTAADGPRRKEAQRIVNERRRDIQRGVSVRSSDNEKENIEDVRQQIGEEVRREFVEETWRTEEVLRKAREEHIRVEDENRRNDERRMLEAEEMRRTEQKEKILKRKESLLRKLVEQSKCKEHCEARREEVRRWNEEEGKLKFDVEKFKKSVDPQTQEEAGRGREESRKDEESREERRKKCLQRILQEEKRRKIEEDRKIQELKQKEDEDKRAREAERKLQELKRREDGEIKSRDVDRKIRKDVQEQTRKQIEEKVQKALKYFKLEEDRQELREHEEMRNFQEAVKTTIRLSQRFRSRVWEESGTESPEPSKWIPEDHRDKIDQRKFDENLRRWRTDETNRRAMEDSWTMPEQERSNLEEQRKRVDDVMKMSKRLHRKFGQSLEDEARESEHSTQRTGEDKDNTYTPPENGCVPDDDEDQNRGFHESIAFLDQFLNLRGHQRARMEEEMRFARDGERFNISDIFAKPEKTKQDDLRKQELQRKKAAKAADEQKRKLAQERLRAAKLEAKRLEKLLKEAQKRAKVEERVRQHQKGEEQARQKAAAHTSTRGTQPPRIAAFRHMTYQQYEESWHLIKISRRTSLLRYADIPWPPHDNPLFVEAGDSIAAQRRKLRTALLRWHPDKFLSLCGNRLSPSERGCIEARAKTLAQEVMQWKSKLDSISYGNPA